MKKLLGTIAVFLFVSSAYAQDRVLNPRDNREACQIIIDSFVLSELSHRRLLVAAIDVLGGEVVLNNICNNIGEIRLNYINRYIDRAWDSRNSDLKMRFVRSIWPEFTRHYYQSMGQNNYLFEEFLEQTLWWKRENNSTLDVYFSNFNSLMRFDEFSTISLRDRLELHRENLSSQNIQFHLERDEFSLCYNFIKGLPFYMQGLNYFSQRCSGIIGALKQGHQNSLKSCLKISSNSLEESVSVVDRFVACGQVPVLEMLELSYTNRDFLAYRRCIGEASSFISLNRSTILLSSLLFCTEESNINRFRSQVRQEWVDYVRNGGVGCELSLSDFSGDISLSDINSSFHCREEWNASDLWNSFSRMTNSRSDFEILVVNTTFNP